MLQSFHSIGFAVPNSSNMSKWNSHTSVEPCLYMSASNSGPVPEKGSYIPQSLDYVSSLNHILLFVKYLTHRTTEAHLLRYHRASLSKNAETVLSAKSSVQGV